METRRQQRNFQLMVITHDFEFVRLLGRGQFTDHYWSVEKMCVSQCVRLLSWLASRGYSSVQMHPMEKLS